MVPGNGIIMSGGRRGGEVKRQRGGGKGDEEDGEGMGKSSLECIG